MGCRATGSASVLSKGTAKLSAAPHVQERARPCEPSGIKVYGDKGHPRIPCAKFRSCSTSPALSKVQPTFLVHRGLFEAIKVYTCHGINEQELCIWKFNL